MSAKSRSSICSHGKKTKVVSVVVYYDTSKASRDVTSTVRGTKRVNVKLKKGGQELIEHMKKIIAHSDLKGDYNRMDETGTLLTLLITMYFVLLVVFVEAAWSTNYPSDLS